MGSYRSLTKWSLRNLLQTINSEVEKTLTDARKLIGHEGEKGGASEEVWRMLMQRHLPLRYQIDTGFIVDSNGQFSEQIDIVVFDRQYSPLVFQLGSRKIFPIESVYAVFEAKQEATAKNIRMAKLKAASVRKLVRTSLPIRDLSGDLKEREPHPIMGGFLSLDSTWKPPMGKALKRALEDDVALGHLDTGCIAAHGLIANDLPRLHSHPATAFLLDLVARLQKLGTVPMIDMSAYAAHLE